MDITTVDTTAEDMPRVGDKILEQVSHSHVRHSHGVFRIELNHHSPVIVPCNNGFIWAAIEVYDSNPRVTIRADEIWLAILAQLKPQMAKFRKNQTQDNIPTFTTEQLNDTAQVAQRLSDTVAKRFDAEKRQVLMPHFSKTTHEDSTSVALLLLGRPCTTTKQRVLNPEEIHYAKHVTVVGQPADWQQLRDKLAAIGSWSNELKTMVNRHSSLLEKMLQNGLQYQDPDSCVTSDPRNPKL
ncbi:DUF4419 domain-containing protein [Fusarium mexicanum]|uniref:DUF4419 domain-containing protein n=1 Tax=Fusarium mexicanum TaxID=751941 RepID=A0A8H5IYP2_9HYPO|nr:DUF4419 domain-containing protein [Fusarium mexicanum]